ncbi:MAG TPA: acyltransferase family protein [Sphingobium sp.]|uniref:acyltransferase family protein n=1 Tax=Sphingobium sp. TaxID=1912891 RepID=UPI002ED11689
MGAGQPHRREHFWDAARAFLMILGIPYHVALAFRPVGQDWIIYSPDGAGLFTYLAEFIHLFRMPAFFVIAGYFAALLLARRAPGPWLQGRLTRLGVPFITAILILVPPLNMVTELSNFSLPEALRSWEYNSTTSGGYWVRHLWFIIVLLYCCTAAAALVRFRPGLARAMVPERVDGWMARNFPMALMGMAVLIGLWEGGVIELFYKAGLATNVPQQILRIDDLISSAPYFILGFLLMRSPATLDRMRRFSPTILIVAIGATAFSLATIDEFWPPVGRFIGTLSAVALTQVVIAGACRFLDRPIPLVQRFVSASFVVYLVHLPIILLLILLGRDIAMPAVPKALSIMLLSLMLSYAIWLVVERSPILSFLFNGEPLSRKEPPRRYLPSNR